MAKTVVRARIDEAIKDEAAAVLAAMGLTVSDAFRLLLVRIAREKALPFEPLVPNAETIEAMKAARRGDLVTVGSMEQLFADLFTRLIFSNQLQSRTFSGRKVGERRLLFS